MKIWIAGCTVALVAVCVPEPASLGLMLAGLAVLFITRSPGG